MPNHCWVARTVWQRISGWRAFDCKTLTIDLVIRVFDSQ